MFTLKSITNEKIVIFSHVIQCHFLTFYGPFYAKIEIKR